MLDESNSLEQRLFDNVLACGLHSLLTRDLEGAEETYRSTYRILRPGGRFLVVLANAYRQSRWSTLEDHWPIIAASGLRKVTTSRDQALPSVWYGRLPRPFLFAAEAMAGPLIGIRNVVVLERPVTSR